MSVYKDTQRGTWYSKLRYRDLEGGGPLGNQARLFHQAGGDAVGAGLSSEKKQGLVHVLPCFCGHLS